MQDLIILAQELAEEAGKIIRPYFRANIEVDHKSDESPVTVADRSVEKRLREIIERKRPEDGIIGEEFGIKEGKNQYDWVLDPIDGTKSFIAGRPSFGTLIALCENGIPILGIIDQPILKERWLGVKEQQTLFNGKPVQTRKCPSLSEARLISTHPIMVPQWANLERVVDFYIWGGDCTSFGYVASGNMDVAIESHLKIYDYAALPPIIEGAGGWMGDWNGNPLHTKSGSEVIAIGDITLKDQILDILNA